MRNLKLIVEYDGTNYSGWQVQRVQSADCRGQKKTIQEALEKALSQILQDEIKVIGSGRTDTGVHALGQVANFKTNSRLNCTDIQRALNSVLAHDIRIKQVENADPSFHARFWAQSKHYRYTIVNDSYISPHFWRYAHLVRYPLDIRKMRQAATLLLGRKNLRSFQAQDKRERGSTRTIKRLGLRKNKNIIYLDIEAEGFLYHMARNIVGTLIEVGRGRLKVQQIKDILKAENRIYAGPCAPAKGLCLMNVRYKKG